MSLFPAEEKYTSLRSLSQCFWRKSGIWISFFGVFGAVGLDVVGATVCFGIVKLGME